MEITKRGDVCPRTSNGLCGGRLEPTWGKIGRNAKDAWTLCPRRLRTTLRGCAAFAHQGGATCGWRAFMARYTDTVWPDNIANGPDWCLKCPRMVVKMASQVWRYLRTLKDIRAIAYANGQPYEPFPLGEGCKKVRDMLCIGSVEREMMGITIEDATIDSVIVLRWKGNSTIGNGHGGIGYLIPTFSIRWPGIRIIRVEIHSEGRAVTVW